MCTEGRPEAGSEYQLLRKRLLRYLAYVLYAVTPGSEELVKSHLFFDQSCFSYAVFEL